MDWEEYPAAWNRNDPERVAPFFIDGAVMSDLEDNVRLLGKDHVKAIADTEMAATSMFPPKAGQRKDRAADRSSSTDRAVSPGVELTRQQTMAELEELFIYVRRCEAFWRFSDRLDKALNHRRRPDSMTGRP
jgi:hypothetical protein